MSIICFSGQAASGKDSIVRELIKKDYKRIVSHTTRPMRMNEKDGVEYYFHKSFDEAKNPFNVKIYKNEWYYWFEEEDVMNAVNSDDTYITIADVDGSLKLQELGAVLIYIYAPLATRLERYFTRESKNDNPDYKEVIRRILADHDDFETFQFDAIGGDIDVKVISNYLGSLENTVAEVEKFIREVNNHDN